MGALKIKARPLGVMFGIPAYREMVHRGHVIQMMSMVSTVFASRGLISLRGFLSPDSCNVDWSRNSLLYAALKDKSDWLLMMDADTYHRDAGDLFKMVEEGEMQRAAVIAAPVRIRKGTEHNVKGGFDFQGEVKEVDRIGAACMAVNVRWIHDHWPDQPWFATQHKTGPVPSKVGEDVYFCDGVRERGGKILGHGLFEPIHHGVNYADR